jgi:hypothetical protein
VGEGRGGKKGLVGEGKRSVREEGGKLLGDVFWGSFWTGSRECCE